MKHVVNYKIADITIQVIFDFVYYAEYSYMNQFLVEKAEKIDYIFKFCKIDNIAPFMKKAPDFKGAVQKFHYYQDRDGKEYCFHLSDKYYHAVTEIGENEGTCYYISQGLLNAENKKGYYLENFFCLEKILMQFQCMVLHSCHIHKDGSAILFSAPSGTGKSTQGSLWEKYAGAEVINGDRTAIRKTKEGWKAYGLPFCGTSGIHQNKQAPLKAIVVLRQNKENQVFVLKGKEAFFSIYSEITVNSWNQSYVNQAINWTMELLAEVPIYMFLCTKEPEAVTILRDFMDKKKVEAR